MESTPSRPLRHRDPIVANVIWQHADEAAILHHLRTALATGPDVTLARLHTFDDRLAAHLEGLSLAGEQAWSFCQEALDVPSCGALFAAAVRAIEDRLPHRLDGLLALAEASPEIRPGLLSAFGWLEPEQLRGIVAALLASDQPFRRMAGIAACSMHRIDPGLVSRSRLLDVSPVVRARALRTAGEIGFLEALPLCSRAIRDDHPECGFWAAKSLVLLGSRSIALEVLTTTGLNAGPHRLKAFRLGLQVASMSAAHGMLRRLTEEPAQVHWLIQGSGIAGDLTYVPWLIHHMESDVTARVAGEAFSLITGADMDASKLDRPRPERFVSGPTDDPDDSNVAMDRDDGLPWPDPERVQRWWDANKSRFPPGQRYFMGAPVTREHCIEVLKNGYQRQRILAAHYLCLLDPGTPLFNTSAPAWRQQRLLAGMH